MRLHSLVVAATDEIVLGGGVWKEPYLAGALLCVVGCWKSGWRVKTAQAYIFKKLTPKNEILIKKDQSCLLLGPCILNNLEVIPLSQN